jgi:hypothetical protein
MIPGAGPLSTNFHDPTTAALTNQIILAPVVPILFKKALSLVFFLMISFSFRKLYSLYIYLLFLP